ncbi:MAG TPA: non-canonical purine NTP pyrophosphatase [Aggregatilineaceae bacterium]|nr:non-canonical purine NTP pyrophosphatase [Aggregatilineaceae bacterium]
MNMLYFVSSNEEKYREIRGALWESGIEVERIALDLPEIQSLDPAEVAAYKARKAHERLQTGSVLVEDTGLEILAWDGFPGALIKWVLKTIGEDGLCRQLNAWTDRRARATVVLCLFDGYEMHVFHGQSEGTITAFPRGEFGFGWDSIFQPDGYNQTYGEMPREAKMQISMRGRAVEALKQFLLL